MLQIQKFFSEVVMNQSCLLGDLWLCHGLWDGAMVGAGGSRRGAESQAILWGPLSFLCFTLPGSPPSYPPSCHVYTLYIFNSHIPPSNVSILLPLYCKNPTTVFPLPVYRKPEVQSYRMFPPRGKMEMLGR